MEELFRISQYNTKKIFIYIFIIISIAVFSILFHIYDLSINTYINVFDDCKGSFLSEHDYSPISFSKEPGFYIEPFNLEILGSESNENVYYTIDGSEPTLDSILYTEPIPLDNKTYCENVYSARDDVSTGFQVELIEEYSTSNPEYVVPEYNVDKCNVIRAAAFDDFGNKIQEISASYFIGMGNIDTYKDLMVVSLITDPENLFNYDNGIYVIGKTFELYKTELLSDEEKWPKQYWWWWTSNYSARGVNSERTAFVELYDVDKRIILNEKCGIRIQGGGSRGALPKSIGFYARKKYGDDNEFSEDIFGIGSSPHKFVMFSGGDDNKYKIKDYLAHSMEKELCFSTMKFFPAVMFIDGEFWGTYYLTENYNADYISDHYEVVEDDVVIIKGGDIATGYSKDVDLYKSIKGFIVSNDMSDVNNYSYVKKNIDIDSYIDYYAAQIFIGRYNDWPGSNEAMWRTRSVKNDGTYSDGKFRWMLYDVNSGGLSMNQLEVDTLANTLAKDEMFFALFQNHDFQNKFAEQLCYIANEVYSDDKIDDFIDAYLENMMPSLCASNKRFYGKEMKNEIIENAEEIRTFLKQRSDYIDIMIRNNVDKDCISNKYEI